MSDRFSLKAAPRVHAGSRSVNRLRKAGSVPAVIYAKGQARSIQVNSMELANMLNAASSEHILVNLDVQDDRKYMALLQEVQHHPIKDVVLHADFHEIDETETITVEVPVVEVGEPAGVKTGGGVLEHPLRSLEIECLPKDLPSKIMVDVSALELNQALHVNEIALPEGVTVLNDPDLPVFIVQEPKVSEEAAPSEEAAQPEVITEKKPEGEEKAEKK